jgi:carboxymethylenebutenolidase
MKPGMQHIDANGELLEVYMALPEGKAKGGLIVIHEVWGLLEHIKNVTNRFAAEGFVTIAPDLLADTDLEALVTPQLFKDFSVPERRAQMQVEFRKIMGPLSSPEFSQKTTSRLKGLFAWLKAQPETGGKVAVVGFCFGGTYSFELAANEPELIASVPFYGHASEDPEQLKAVTCPILAFYGDKDENLMNQLPKLRAVMAEAHVDFRETVYSGAGHAFFNDMNPLTYNEAAAKDAWQKTLAFLDDNFRA